jgi:hypothetical protein
MELLKKIAKRNVERMIKSGSDRFDLLQTFISSYDKSSKTHGTDRQLFEYMINELGYEKPQSGCGWIKM